jgi:hypothetical protein
MYLLQEGNAGNPLLPWFGRSVEHDGHLMFFSTREVVCRLVAVWFFFPSPFIENNSVFSWDWLHAW